MSRDKYAAPNPASPRYLPTLFPILPTMVSVTTAKPPPMKSWCVEKWCALGRGTSSEQSVRLDRNGGTSRKARPDQFRLASDDAKSKIRLLARILGESPFRFCPTHPDSWCLEEDLEKVERALRASHSQKSHPSGESLSAMDQPGRLDFEYTKLSTTIRSLSMRVEYSILATRAVSSQNGI